MCGWGRFVEHWGNGNFLAALKRGDWLAVARTYNGYGPHAYTYAGWLKTLHDKYVAQFKAAGYPLTAADYTP